jgi:hypothetical protein
MKLNNDDKPWCPGENLDYLCVLGRNQPPPKTAELLLVSQVRLLQRLVAEARPDEVEDANRRLNDNLQDEELLNLPLGGFKNRRTANILLVQPAALGYKLADWKEGLAEAVNLPPMPEKEAREEAECLTLESFLGRVL